MITYSEEALEYISKLSSGGLRDAITMMDKCLSYSRELTLENVVKALGITDYDTMIDLTDSYINRENKNIIKIIEQIHNDGKDLKQFIRQYINFVLDIKKWLILDSFEYINLPKVESIETMLNNILADRNRGSEDIINELLNLLIKINTNIKYDSSPKYLIEAYIIGREVI